MRVFAGPWTGEFGYELLWWSPMLRAASRGHNVHIRVASRKSSGHLYEFASEFTPVEINVGIFTRGSVKDGDTEPRRGEAHWNPKLLLGSADPRCDTPPFPVEHRRLGVPETRYDTMVALRQPKKTSHFKKSWPRGAELVERLIATGLKVACYGPGNLIGSGAADLRNTPLNELVDLLAGAKCAVGGSSGGMHLAQLCGTHAVVWYPWNPSRKRYEETWNPFRAGCTWMGNTNDPNPEDVEREVLRLVNTTDS